MCRRKLPCTGVSNIRGQCRAGPSAGWLVMQWLACNPIPAQVQMLTQRITDVEAMQATTYPAQLELHAFRGERLGLGMTWHSFRHEALLLPLLQPKQPLLWPVPHCPLTTFTSLPLSQVLLPMMCLYTRQYHMLPTHSYHYWWYRMLPPSSRSCPADGCSPCANDICTTCIHRVLHLVMAVCCPLS